jgi:hypothetical protein
MPGRQIATTDYTPLQYRLRGRGYRSDGAIESVLYNNAHRPARLLPPALVSAAAV